MHYLSRKKEAEAEIVSGGVNSSSIPALITLFVMR